MKKIPSNEDITLNSRNWLSLYSAIAIFLPPDLFLTRENTNGVMKQSFKFQCLEYLEEKHNHRKWIRDKEHSTSYII